MGELDARLALALSGMRGDAKYSVLWEGDGSGSAAGLGLGTGSSEARLEALRFAWPGLRYENMFEGAIAAARVGCVVGRYAIAIAIAIALLPRGGTGTDGWRPEAQSLSGTGGGASQRGNAPAETIAGCFEGGAGSWSRRKRAKFESSSDWQRPSLRCSSTPQPSHDAGKPLERAYVGRHSTPISQKATARSLPGSWDWVLQDAWLELWTRSRCADAKRLRALEAERSSRRAGGVSSVQVQPSGAGSRSVLSMRLPRVRD